MPYGNVTSTWGDVGEWHFTDEFQPGLSRSITLVLRDRLSYLEEEGEIDNETLAKAAMFEALHSGMQGMAAHLRPVGLCRHAEFDSMMDAISPVIPDKKLLADFYPYSWAEIRKAHYRVTSLPDDYEDMLSDKVLEAGKAMEDIAKIIESRLRSYAIVFEKQGTETDAEFCGKAVRAMKALGIPEDLDAYLSGRVPVADIVA